MGHPQTFNTGDDFMEYMYKTGPRGATDVEMQGHGHWIAFVNSEPFATYDEETKMVNWAPADIQERHQPMEMLKELLQLNEAEKKKKVKVSKKAVKDVYHRDYVKTKNKPYRKYDPEEYVKDKKD